MGIADEVRAVLAEVGSLITVRKPNGTETSTDYMDSNDHTEHTNPAIRAFFFDISLHSPTVASVGDTIRWGQEPNITEMLITAMAPQMFENVVVEYVASGYRVNTKGGFYKYDQDAPPGPDYDENNFWVLVYPELEIRGTIMDQLYRSRIKSIGRDSMDVTTSKLQMFVSDYFSEVAMGMQWRSNTGRVYKVDHIEDHNFVGIRAIFLSEETRP
jgi:hypothetical protein